MLCCAVLQIISTSQHFVSTSSKSQEHATKKNLLTCSIEMKRVRVLFILWWNNFIIFFKDKVSAELVKQKRWKKVENKSILSSRLAFQNKGSDWSVLACYQRWKPLFSQVLRCDNERPQLSSVLSGMGGWPNADHIPVLRESGNAGWLRRAKSEDSVKETEVVKKKWRHRMLSLCQHSWEQGQLPVECMTGKILTISPQSKH